MSAPARTSVRRAMSRNEPRSEQLARHARYVAADPLLEQYHRDREARLLDEAAIAVEGALNPAAVLRHLAAQHRNGRTG